MERVTCNSTPYFTYSQRRPAFERAVFRSRLMAEQRAAEVFVEPEPVEDIEVHVIENPAEFDEVQQVDRFASLVENLAKDDSEEDALNQNADVLQHLLGSLSRGELNLNLNQKF